MTLNQGRLVGALRSRGWSGVSIPRTPYAEQPTGGAVLMVNAKGDIAYILPAGTIIAMKDIVETVMRGASQVNAKVGDGIYETIGER
jgi:hypothetical protein